MTPYETLADVLSSLGKKDELIDRLEKLHAAEPNNAPLGYYLAAQYRAAGKVDKAETLYVALLKTQPTLAGYRSLVEMYRQAKRFDALLAAIGDAVEKTGVLETLGTEAQAISADAEAMRRLDRRAGRSPAEGRARQVRLRPAAWPLALLALEAKQYEVGRASSSSRPWPPSPSTAAEVFMVWGVGC